MKQAMLVDEALVLRAPEMNDLDMLYLWENDSEQWNVGNAVAPYSRKQLWDYIDTYEADIFASRQMRFVIEEKSSHKAIGTIDVFDFDPVNRHASVGIYIDVNARKQGYAKRAIDLLCEYCFTHIGMHSLTALTAVNNEPAQRLFKACRFKTCGCLRSWVRIGNQYEDVVVLQLLA